MSEFTAPPLPAGVPERPDVGPVDGDRIRALDRAHVLHTWSAQASINPTPIVAASGCWLWDDQDNRYFDFASQLVNVNLGHNHPALVAAIQQQAARMSYIAPSAAEHNRSELARQIVELAGDQFAKVFFTNGGADANEHAVRMARAHTGRRKILTAYKSYHGGTQLAMGMTTEPRGWMLEQPPGFVHFFRPHLYRSPFGAVDEAQETASSLDHLAAVIANEGPGTIAAVMLETVVGTNGAIPPPAGWLAGVADLCRANGILLILDEVMVGFGRTGHWFAHHAHDVRPDLVTFAKGVNCGTVPVGGVIVSSDVAATFDDRVYPGGLTNSGHPLGCAAGLATIKAMRDEGILERVQDTEPWLRDQLHEMAARHPSVGDVRGVGMFWAMELVADTDTHEPLTPPVHGLQAPMTQVVAAIKAHGVMPFAHQNRVQFAPPLTATREELAWALAVVDHGLDVADRFVA